MPNGFELRGFGGTKLQPTVIVPNPTNHNIYYLFTTNPYNGPAFDGFSYSIVDLSLDGGLGDVITKKVPLAYPLLLFF